jgi:hypothetical protein
LIVAGALLSITLNPLLFYGVEKWLAARADPVVVRPWDEIRNNNDCLTARTALWHNLA